MPTRNSRVAAGLQSKASCRIGMEMHAPEELGLKKNPDGKRGQAGTRRVRPRFSELSVISSDLLMRLAVPWQG